MKRIKLEESFKEDGKFWLHEYPDKAIDGTLDYQPGSMINVALVGTLPDANIKSRRLPSVQGRTMRGQRLTLLGAVEDIEHSSPVGERGRIQAACMLAGGHYSNEAALMFSQCMVHMSSLEEWYGKRMFVLTQDQNRVQRKGENIPTTTFRSEVLGAQLELFMTEQANELSMNEIRVSHVTKIHLIPDKPESLTWFETQVRRLEHLFNILIGDIVSLREFQLREHPSDQWLNYIFADIGRSQPAKPRDAHSMPFSFRRISERLAEIFDNWFRLELKCGDALDLLFSTLRANSLVPLAYLSLMQAVEGILRAREPGLFISEEKFGEIWKAMVHAIPNGTDDQLRQALKTRLKYGNQWSLRRRLKEALCRFPNNLRALVLGQERLNDFIGRTVEGRNYWTHYDPNEKATKLSITEAAIISSRILTLGVITLYLELGLEPGEIHERMTRTCAYVPALAAHSYRDFSGTERVDDDDQPPE